MRHQYTPNGQLALPGFEPEGRRCIGCGLSFAATTEFFYFHPKSKFSSRCKPCHNGICRERYYANREHRRKTGRAYYEAHKEQWAIHGKARYEAKKAEILKQCAVYRAENKEKLDVAKKIWRERNKDRLSQRARERYQANKDKAAEYRAAWREKNREHANQYSREWLRRSPSRKVAHQMSTRINYSLKGGKGRIGWQEVVGYSSEELMAHLESRFKPGMTWENYGRKGWHVDHIRPIASFTFDSYDDPQFRECWALSNLQPLWEPENLSKKDKIL